MCDWAFKQGRFRRAGDFVIPNAELIPEEVRQKVRKRSDYADYWAMDWDFQNDTFMNQWASYRTRRDRSLKLATDPPQATLPSSTPSSSGTSSNAASALK